MSQLPRYPPGPRDHPSIQYQGILSTIYQSIHLSYPSIYLSIYMSQLPRYPSGPRDHPPVQYQGMLSIYLSIIYSALNSWKSVFWARFVKERKFIGHILFKSGLGLGILEKAHILWWTTQFPDEKTYIFAFGAFNSKQVNVSGIQHVLAQLKGLELRKETLAHQM